MPIILPEIILQNTLDSILSQIKVDWNANVDKTKTILYKFWNGVTRGTFNYYQEAQTIFLTSTTSSRQLKVKPAYPQNASDFPCIIVNVPSESSGGDDSLGFDENKYGASFDDDNFTFTDTSTRNFDSTYSILIFSDNREETVLIYHTLKAMFVAVNFHLQESGIDNLKISGRELQMMPSDIVPKNTFVRALNISGHTELTVESIFTNSMAQNITFPTQTITQ